MKRLAFLALAVLPTMLFAGSGSATVSYTRATTYTDGSALASTDIVGHTVACAFTPVGGTAAPCTNLTGAQVGNVASANVTLDVPATGGVACFTVATRTAAATSAPSAVTAASCKTFAALVPSPPTNVTVTVTVTVQTTPVAATTITR